MIALVQRCKKASVTVNDEIVGKINNGVTVFVGVFKEDGEKECDFLAKKLSNLRIFTDNDDKMNLSLLDVNSEVLAISNFTLCANAKKGTRPSYDSAARPETANPLYERFCTKLLENGIKNVQKGIFGAHMEVLVANDGPVSVILDTDKIMAKNNG